MTIPTFEAGDVPEFFDSEFLGESPTIHLNSVGGMQATRLLAGNLFSFARVPSMQAPMAGLPRRLSHHPLVTNFIHRFNPSFPQLVLLLLFNKHKFNDEKPEQKISQGGKQEAEKGGDPKEIFKKLKNEGLKKEPNVSQKGGPNPKTEAPPQKVFKKENSDEPVLKKEKNHFQDSKAASPKIQDHKPSLEKSLATKGPSKENSNPESQAHEPESLPENSLEENMAMPEAQSLESSPVDLVDSQNFNIFGHSELEPPEMESHVALIEITNLENKTEAGQDTRILPIEESTIEQPDQFNEELIVKEESREKKDSSQEKSNGSGSNNIFISKGSEGDTTKTSNQSKYFQEGKPQKNNESAKSQTSQPSSSSQKNSKFPIQSFKNEPIPVKASDQFKPREGSLKAQMKDAKMPPVMVDSEIARSNAEETTQTNYRANHAIDRGINLQVPPWLAQILPDLAKTGLHGKKGGGGKAGKVNQNPHKLSDMLFMILCSQFGGAKTLLEVIRFIEAREKWFITVLGLRHGLPPRQLLFWLLATLDSRKFERVISTWLLEVLGAQANHSPWLQEIIIWQTPIGFALGQSKNHQPKGNAKLAIEIADGLLFEDCVVMTSLDLLCNKLLSKIQESKGDYLAEVKEELHPSQEYLMYESYIEGQERTLLKEWSIEGSSEIYLKATSEFFDSQQTILKEENFISTIEQPSNYYFDLSRIQRPYLSKTYWLLNISLNFPSIDKAIQRCNASLTKFHSFSCEFIKKRSSMPIEKQMEKAATDLSFLIQLAKAS